METGARSSPLSMDRWVRLLLVCVFLPAVYSQWMGNLSVYEISSFDNPIKQKINVETQLDHFSVHHDTGDVYVGAVNYIYRLDENLVQTVNVSTATGIGEESVNYNKILVLQGDRLITCGSEMGGRCMSRNEGDLLDDGSSGGRNVRVASSGMYTTASIVAPRPDSGERLYVAATYCTECGALNVPPISRRMLIADNGFMSADASSDSLIFNDAYTGSAFPINYVNSFLWNRFTYFVTFQQQNIKVYSHVSKISRVCHESNNLDSYTEILISCQAADDSVYSLVQAAHVGPAGPHLSESLSLGGGDQVLYAAFSKNAPDPAEPDIPIPTKGSALCVYKMSDIETAFEDVVKGCLSGSDSDMYTVGYLQGSRCAAGTPTYCNTDYKYAEGIVPVQTTAVLELPEHLASSIITSIELNHTVAFIGTTESQLLKVHVESGSTARLYEQVPIEYDDDLKQFTDNPVMRDIMINETTEELFLLTEQRLIKMRVENCGQYTTCETCIGTDAERDGDPYCGWCTLQRQCTRYHECPMQYLSSRWLSYNDPQCIEISTIAPYDSLPITVSDLKINLTVEQLPDLRSGMQYVCKFDDQYSNQALHIAGDTLGCTTPPRNMVPEIISGEDHSTMLLSIESTETNISFVDRNFSFYECSTHKSCVSCVGSRWACNWCVSDDKCTHDNSSCTRANESIITGQNNSESSMDGPNACPQLAAQSSEVVVPTSVAREIIVETMNLPDEEMVMAYTCSLNIDGSMQSVNATPGDNNVICSMRKYTYTEDSQELEVNLKVEWTDNPYKVKHQLDDRYEFKVTLYKCESQRPDCSRCVSNETTRAELQCVWCDNTCVFDEVCMPPQQSISQTNGRNCRTPIIQTIFPMAGPIEGNTPLTLNGTDLGRRFSDIKEVTVGCRICDLEGFMMDYETGASVTCNTSNNSDLNPQTLQVTITGANGTVQMGTGDPKFTYKDPVLGSFTPITGPKAGGTIVNITGFSLDAGRNIKASIGGSPCTIVRSQVTDSHMTCVTTAADKPRTSIFSVHFDEAVRNITTTFAYAEDPRVISVNPSKSVVAGGRKVKVNGSSFSVIQKPQILITVDDNQFKGDCRVVNDREMICISPAVKLPDDTQLDTPSKDSVGMVSTRDRVNDITTGFIMDGVVGLLRWCSDTQAQHCTPMEYVQNPIYYTFDHRDYGNTDGIEIKDGSTLHIRGEKLDLAITKDEIKVYIGQELCTNIMLGPGNLFCTLPEEQPAPGDNLGMNTLMNLPIVRVIHGSSLTFDIGYMSYRSKFPTTLVVSLVSGIVLVGAFILVLVLYRQSKITRKAVEQTRADMINMQLDFAEDFAKACNDKEQKGVKQQ